jgi:hypothetical protein
MTLTANYLNLLFEYKDGTLYRKVSKGAVKAGKKVGTPQTDGCLTVSIDKKCYLVHRIIFMMHNGYFPEMVDHIDGNRTNNKIENLREATHAQNAWNSKPRADSNIGIKNITYNKKFNQYTVRIQVNQERKYIGAFKDLELAALVAMEARNKYHGKFANHGAKL